MAAGAAVPSSAQRLLAYFRPFRFVLAVAGVAVAVRSMTDPALAYLLFPLSEAAQAKSGAEVTVDVERLRGIMAWLLVIGSLVALSDLGSNFCFDYAAQRVIHDLRRDLFAQIHTLPLSFFESRRTGELVSRATNDLGTVQSRLNVELTRLIKCPLSMVFLLVVMFKISTLLTLLCVGVVVVLVPLVNLAGRTMRRHVSQLQDRLATLTARLQESIAGIRVVHCFGAGQLEIERFAAENAAARRAVMRAVRVRSMLEPVQHLVGLIGLEVVLFVGGVLLVSANQLHFGRFAVVALSLQVLVTNFKQFGRARLAAAEVVAAADKVFALLDIRAEITDAPDALCLPALEGRVTFDDVSFAYGDGPLVLRGIRLEVAPGETIALVGPSGAGKTTLTNLIPRLYDPTSGAVRVDGHDLRRVQMQSLRVQMGIVPQETLLFSGTIRHNIAYARPTASDEEVRAAAAAANALSFIEALPEGLEAEVGERGVKLSGGQAQRIAIARALLRDPRILILDEATSSLDSESEAQVQEAFERLMHGRTTFVIAHRLSTVVRADRIVVLDEGLIVACGTHEELLAGDGYYRRAFAMQGGLSG